MLKLYYTLKQQVICTLAYSTQCTHPNGSMMITDDVATQATVNKSPFSLNGHFQDHQIVKYNRRVDPH